MKNRSTKLFFAALICLLFFAVSFFTVAEGQKEKAEPSAEMAKIVYLDPMVPPYRLEVMKAMAEDFKKANPNIDIELQATSSWGEQRTKLMTAIAGGGGPDVFSQNFMSFPTYASEGIMENLDPYIDKDPAVDTADFFKPLIEGCQSIDGNTYGLPITVTLMISFYNKDLFEQAGVSSFPKDLNEFRDTGMKINDLGDDIYGFASFSKVKVTVDSWLADYFFPMGGELLNNDRSKILFNSDAGRKATQMMVDNVHKHNFQAPLGTEATDLFARGQAGICTFWPYIYGYLEQNAPDLEWGAAGVPVGDLGKPVSLGNIIILSMLSSSKQKDAAWKWISYLMEYDGHFRYNKERNHIPARADMLESDYFKNHPAWSVYLAQVPHMKLYPADFEKYLDMSNTLNEELENAVVREKSPTQALSDAAAQSQKYLK
jgi:multiple sugar transport system substrate-binding protein